MKRLNSILSVFKKTLAKLEKLEATLGKEEEGVHDLIAAKQIEAEGLAKEREQTAKVITNIKGIIGE